MDPQIPNLMILLESATRQSNWADAHALAGRLLSGDTRVVNFWMLRGYSRFRLGLLSGDWSSVSDMASDYRSALDLMKPQREPGNGPMPTYVMERFAQEIKPAVRDLVARTFSTLDGLTSGVRKVGYMEKTIYGAAFGIAKVMKNNTQKEQARAFLEEVIPVVGHVQNAIQILRDGYDCAPGLACFGAEMSRHEADLRHRFQGLAPQAADTTVGDLLWGKWSRRFRS